MGPPSIGGSGGSGFRPRASTSLDGMHSVNNQDQAWASPAAAGPVSARVRLPASKSVTNRALVLAALGDGPAVIANPLRARDTALAAGALRALGSEIKRIPNGLGYHARPAGSGLRGERGRGERRHRDAVRAPRWPR